MRFLIIVISLISLISSAFSQTDSTIAFPPQSSVQEKLNWEGYLHTDDRFGLHKPDNKLNFQEYRLSLKPSYKTSRTAFGSEIWIRSVLGQGIDSYKSISDRQKVSPTDVDMREAWFDVYDFLVPGLDMRLGKQRIAWGTADRLNPTDNLNPYDLEDVWDFGRHLASNSVKLSYYISDFTLTAVFIPGFTPSLGPGDEWLNVFTPDFSFPDEFNLGIFSMKLINKGLNDKLVLPTKNLKESSSWGMKVGKNIGNFSTSVSFAHTRDIMPAPYKAVIIPVEITPAFDTLIYTLDAELKYPRMRILGFDFAGSVKDVGIWGEAALFFPEMIRLTSEISVLGLNLNVFDSLVLDDKPFLKYVFGADYSFPNNIYINLQYLHGFIHEKGSNGLNDYFIFAGEWTTMRDKLKISPANFCLQLNNWKNFSDNYAFVFLPEIAYKPAGSIEIGLGARLIQGHKSTMFGKMNNMDHIFIKCKLSF